MRHHRYHEEPSRRPGVIGARRASRGAGRAARGARPARVPGLRLGRRRSRRRRRGDVWRARAANGTRSLDDLTKRVEKAPAGMSTGIGHTRWATHGRPSDENAHPHADCTGRIALVHNGIIENHIELSDELRAAGHTLRVGDRHRGSRPPHRGQVWPPTGDGRSARCRRALGRMRGTFAWRWSRRRRARPHRGRSASFAALVGWRPTAPTFLASDIPASWA